MRSHLAYLFWLKVARAHAQVVTTLCSTIPFLPLQRAGETEGRMQHALAEKVAKRAVRTVLLQHGTVQGISLCSCVEVVVSSSIAVERTWSRLQRQIGLRALLAAFAVWYKQTEWSVHGEYFGRILWPYDVLTPEETDGQHDYHLSTEIEYEYLTLSSELCSWWCSVRYATNIFRLRRLLQMNNLEQPTNEVWALIGAFLVGRHRDMRFPENC